MSSVWTLEVLQGRFWLLRIINLAEIAMKVQVEIPVVLKELHFNFHRSECIFSICPCINQESRNEDGCRIFSIAGKNNAMRRFHWANALFIRFTILQEQRLCVCNPWVDVISDTIMFGEAFCSLVVQQDKIWFCHRTILGSAPTPQCNYQNIYFVTSKYDRNNNPCAP